MKHAFRDALDLDSGLAARVRRTCADCGQPPDAEVHQAGQGQSTYDLYAARERAAACGKFNPCQLGDSGLPDHNFTCALLCQDCGMNEPAHAPPLPSTEKPDDGKPPHDYVPCGPDCGCSDPHCHYVCGVEDGLILYCGEGKDDLVQHPRTEKPAEARLEETPKG